jgi:hypothetical protein
MVATGAHLWVPRPALHRTIAHVTNGARAPRFFTPETIRFGINPASIFQKSTNCHKTAIRPANFACLIEKWRLLAIKTGNFCGHNAACVRKTRFTPLPFRKCATQKLQKIVI